MKRWLLALLGCFWLTTAASAADLDVNTPRVATLKQAMQARMSQLGPLLAQGVVGLTRDGGVAVRDPAKLPLAQRGPVNAVVSAENQDRSALYDEIARANGHPEWASDVRATFARRWIDRARAGWWVQAPSGQWSQK